MPRAGFRGIIDRLLPRKVVIVIGEPIQTGKLAPISENVTPVTAEENTM